MRPVTVAEKIDTAYEREREYTDGTDEAKIERLRGTLARRQVQFLEEQRLILVAKQILSAKGKKLSKK